MPRTREVIFRAHIDLASKEQRNRNYGWPEVQEAATKVITVRMPELTKHLTKRDIVVEIREVREGSLTIFFAAVISLYGLIGGYKDFADSVELIRDQTRDLLAQALKRFGDFDVDVATVYPRIIPPDVLQANRMRETLRYILERDLTGGRPSPNQPLIMEIRKPTRDGFFWFLLFLSLAELGAIIALVYRAVDKTYFSP